MRGGATVEALSEWVIGFIAGGQNSTGLVLLAASAAIEYIFPPFPGDTITLFGAFLVTSHGWSFVAVFGAVMLGSVAGSMLAFYLGHRIGPPSDNARLHKVVERFRRYGAAYLVVNRFLPGLRSLFFVAAGMAELRPWRVAFFSAISAAAWNLALMGVGAALGANYEVLLTYVKQYTLIVWIAIASVAVVCGTVWWIRRRKRKKATGKS